MLVGGVVTKNAFTNLILYLNPKQVFYALKFKKKKYSGNQSFFGIFWMFIHHPSKFGKFSLKIGGEIIFQSWPLFNLFSQLTHCALSDRVEIFLRYRWSPPQKNIKQFLCHRSYWLSKRNLKFTNTFSLFLSCVKYLMLFDVFNSSPQFYSHPACRCE